MTRHAAPASDRTGVPPCPLCGGRTHRAFVTRDRNRGITREPFSYAQCTVCRSLFLENPPSDMGRYYPDGYFSLPSLEGLRREAAGERYRMDIVARHRTGGRLTEIGPGNGVFAVQAVDSGFDTAAIEMSPDAAAYLRTEIGVEVEVTDHPERVLPNMPASSVVAAWHVLEHVPDPWALLDAVAANLEPGGVFVVATPNPRAFGFRLLRGRWPHVDAPRHLFLIDHEALAARAQRAGLELVELTATDPGGLHWNAFAWHYLLRRPGASWPREVITERIGRIAARVLAPFERRGLRGAAYTAVLRKR